MKKRQWNKKTFNIYFEKIITTKKCKSINKVTVANALFWDICEINNNLNNSLFNSNLFEINLLNNLNDDLFYNNVEDHRIYIFEAINTRSFNLFTNRMILLTKLWIYVSNNILQWFLWVQDRLKNEMHILVTLYKMKSQISIIFNKARDYRGLFEISIFIKILFIDVVKKIK